MKTAMQQFLEWLENSSDVQNDILNWELVKENALEKEKEQIMNAYCDGAKGGANGNKGQHDFGWVSKYTRKKYYNQTYNQNK
jgi:hypothetical protein